MKIFYIITLSLLALMMITNCGRGLRQSTDNSSSSERSSIKVNGIERTFYLDLPTGDYSESRLPLVIALHGGGGSGSQFRNSSGFSLPANREGYAVVYPEGIKGNGILGLRTWNAGTCRGQAAEKGINDVGFISGLIQFMREKYPVNPDKIFTMGMSNGGMMAYKLACTIPEQIQAIAIVSGTLVASSCDAGQPVSILHIHSYRDESVPYEGGYGVRDYYFPSVDSTLNHWAGINNCHSPNIVKEGNYTYKKWAPCNKETSIELYITDDGGHSWPGSQQSRGRRSDPPSKAINANEVILSFFNSQPNRY